MHRTDERVYICTSVSPSLYLGTNYIFKKQNRRPKARTRAQRPGSGPSRLSLQKIKSKSAFTAPQVRFHKDLLAPDLAWCPPLQGRTLTRRSPGTARALPGGPSLEGEMLPSVDRKGRAISEEGGHGAGKGRLVGWAGRRGTGPARRGTRRRSRGAAGSHGPTRSRRQRPAPRSSPACRRWAGPG